MIQFVFMCSDESCVWLVCCRFAVAESDCNLAITLDSKYMKAYARRGAARTALKDHQGALDGQWSSSSHSSLDLMQISCEAHMFFRLWDGSQTGSWKLWGWEWTEETQAGVLTCVCLCASESSRFCCFHNFTSALRIQRPDSWEESNSCDSCADTWSSETAAAAGGAEETGSCLA